MNREKEKKNCSLDGFVAHKYLLLEKNKVVKINISETKFSVILSPIYVKSEFSRKIS